MPDCQLVEQYCLCDGEDDRVCADAKREGADGDCRKSRTLGEHARCVAQIGAQFIPCARSPCFAAGFFLRGQAAEFGACSPECLFARKAAAHQVCGVGFNVEAEFIFDLVAELLRSSDCFPPCGDAAGNAHTSSGVALRIAPMASAMWFHFSV